MKIKVQKFVTNIFCISMLSFPITSHKGSAKNNEVKNQKIVKSLKVIFIFMHSNSSFPEDNVFVVILLYFQ